MTRRSGGRTPSHRHLRIGEELRHVLSDLLQRGAFRDPVLRETSITVTEVRLSRDLGTATAFIRTLGGDNMETALEAIRRAQAHLRSEVAQRVHLRYMPKLRFEIDTSFDQAERIDSLLRLEAVKRDLDTPGDDVEADEGPNDEGPDGEPDDSGIEGEGKDEGGTGDPDSRVNDRGGRDGA